MVKPTTQAADFMAANDESPVVDGRALGEGRGGVYGLENGKSFWLSVDDCRSLPVGYPRWDFSKTVERSDDDDTMIATLQKRVWELTGAINYAAYACRLWAKESRTGGWSTHQVDANNKLADGLEQTVGSVKEQHPDDRAAASFLWAMIEKLAKKRREGRTGWWDKTECSNEYLTKLLREHVDKGDPIDMANLAMMIHQRGEMIGEPVPKPKVRDSDYMDLRDG